MDNKDLGRLPASDDAVTACSPTAEPPVCAGVSSASPLRPTGAGTTHVLMADKDTWCVWTKWGNRPRVFHASREEAEAEAARLAKKNPGRRYLVLHMVSKLWAQDFGEAVAQDASIVQAEGRS
jgi:hypothetical protein